MKFKPFLDGYYDVHGQLSQKIRDMAQIAFEQEKKDKERLRTVADFEKRRACIKERFIKSIGGLDMEKTPLAPQCTGVLEKDEYTIQKIIFESQPKYYVTANLYIPHADGKRPAVLLACGHSDISKAEPKYQALAIELASNGMVVLVVDPIGQGERLQYPGRTMYGRPLRGTLEHSYIGLLCSLIGTALARFFIWDLIRSVDFLESLPFVDETRIGMTGNSGGGTQTAYMMLCEPRIQAAAPSCYITSRLDYLHTGQAHDAEQNIFGAMQFGINYDDFITGMAPKPVTVNSTLYDFFCVEGAKASVERARRIYTLYDAEDKIRWNTAPMTHGFHRPLRQGAIDLFMDTFLPNHDRLVARDEEALDIEPEHRLRCTKTGQVMTEYKDAVHIHDLIASMDHSKKWICQQTDRRALANTVEKQLHFHRSLTDRPQIFERITQNEVADGIRFEKIFFFSEPGICVSGILLHSKQTDARCSILLLENGTDGLMEHKEMLQSLLSKGNVLCFDPRGIGAVKSRSINRIEPHDMIHATDFRMNYDAMMLGTGLAQMRIYDVIRAADFVHKRFGEIPIVLAAQRMCGITALFAALFIDSLEEVVEYDTPESFKSVLHDKHYRFNSQLEIYSVLNVTDLPQIRHCLPKVRRVANDS